MVLVQSRRRLPRTWRRRDDWQRAGLTYLIGRCVQRVFGLFFGAFRRGRLRAAECHLLFLLLLVDRGA